MDVRLRAANRLTQPCIMFTYCPSVCNRTEAFSNRRVCVCVCCWIYSLVNEGFYFTHASGKSGDIVQSACLCLSVCPLAYLKNRICVSEINTQWSLERHYFVYTLSMFNQFSRQQRSKGHLQVASFGIYCIDGYASSWNSAVLRLTQTADKLFVHASL